MQGSKTVSKTHVPAQNPTRHKADMKLHTEDTKSICRHRYKTKSPGRAGDRDVFTHELVNNEYERTWKEEVVVCRHSYRQGELATGN
jgi:hypothetical protein